MPQNSLSGLKTWQVPGEPLVLSSWSKHGDVFLSDAGEEIAIVIVIPISDDDRINQLGGKRPGWQNLSDLWSPLPFFIWAATRTLHGFLGSQTTGSFSFMP